MVHKLLSSIAIYLMLISGLSAQIPADLIIGATVTPIIGKDSVLLSWPVQETGDILITSLDHGSSSFLAKVLNPENQVKIYVKRGEYRTIKLSNSADQNKIQLLCPANFYVQAPQKKKVLLLVTPLIDTGANKLVERWITDAELEGWTIEKIVINEDEQVATVKDTILHVYNNSSDAPLAGVFLLGHIPVPYSGQINPDGHPNHLGAWPADGYYGDLNANYFTDNIVDTDESANPPDREENRNIPGDGKFDASILNSGVELWVGRVDLSNLPVYTDVNAAYDELFLTKRYLDKDHAFRSNSIRPAERSLIDDNFGYFSGEAFAANGWMVGRQFMADSLIEEGDFLGLSANQSYLWGYGCGGGYYNSASGIGNSNDFANDSVNVVFSMLFGSYLGDWDSQNNFMRSALASKGMLLTCAWAGRPDWFFHQMAANFPIGESAKTSMNADNKYSVSYAQKWVHMGLMGDPTLRVNSLLPPTDLTITGTGPAFTLQWTAAPDPNVDYFIFRKSKSDNNYKLLNTSLVSGTEYIDTAAVPGVNEYAVLAGQLIQNRSGIHFAMSNGIYASATYTTTGISKTNTESDVEIVPNPSSNQANLHLTPDWGSDISIQIVSANGKRIISLVNNSTGMIRLPELRPGIYFVQIHSTKTGVSVVKKWIVN